MRLEVHCGQTQTISKLARNVAAEAESAGAEVRILDLKDSLSLFTILSCSTPKLAAVVCACHETGRASTVVNLRMLITALEAIVIPSSDVFYISYDLFDADGGLQNEFDRRRAEVTGRRLVKMIKRFNDFD